MKRASGMLKINYRTNILKVYIEIKSPMTCTDQQLGMHRPAAKHTQTSS